MSKAARSTPRAARARRAPRPSLRQRTTAWVVAGRRGAWRLLLAVVVAALAWVALYRYVDPPSTPYLAAEADRLGGVERAWVDLEDVAPVMARAVVAAEDANFCLHWGFDVDAIRAAVAAGAARGASTITQQTVKNAFLWQGRSWPRKALEATLTPVVEAFWPKRRVLEVYLNVAEMGEGVFGVEAAAQHHFGVRAADLSDVQAARLAAVLPNPKARDPANPSPALRRRAASILDGAATIRADGRAACFEG